MKFLRKLFGLDRPATPAPRARGREFDLKGLERILKYQFRNPELARTAMTHRSHLHATQGRSGESNERMEFLGDSVVGLAVNEFLYNKFPKLREGELTKMKSLLVSRVILSRTANTMGLGQFVLLSDAENDSGGRDRASILADTLEGVIGAVYLDGGLEPARQITERLLLKEVHEILSDANLANYKSMLQEYVQGEFKTHPQYRISSENGPDHHKLFAVDVVVNGRSLGRGHGSNKKEAEQEAARDALLHFEKIVRTDSTSEGPAAGSAPGSSTSGGGQRRRSRRGGRGRRPRGGGRGDEMRTDAGGAPRAPREGQPSQEGRTGEGRTGEGRAGEGRAGEGRTGAHEGRTWGEGRDRRGRRGGGDRPDRRHSHEGRETTERQGVGGEGVEPSKPESAPPAEASSSPWAASRLHTEP